MVGPRFRSLVLALCVNASLFGCAAQQPLLKTTVSGYPEGIFRGSGVEQVKSKLMNACIDNRLLVMESSTNQVVCGKRMEGGDAILTQLAIGNSYSTPPVQKIRFVIFQLDADVRVTAQQWVETQMAFGQMQNMELRSNNHNNGVQQLLFALGAE